MIIVIKIRLTSIEKVSTTQFCVIKIKTLLVTIPAVIRSNDDFIKTFASAVSFLAKLFPKKRCKPF